MTGRHVYMYASLNSLVSSTMHCSIQYFISILLFYTDGMCATMRYLSLKADLLSCSLPRGPHRLNIASLTTGLLVCLGNSLLANYPVTLYNCTTDCLTSLSID